MSKNHKNNLVPRLRFNMFTEGVEWKELLLGEVTYPVSERNKDGNKYPIYSISNISGFVPQSEQFEGVDSHSRGYDVSLYKVIKKDTFAYNPARINIGSLGFSGELNDVLVSSLYVCFKTKNELDNLGLFCFLKTSGFSDSVKSSVEGGIRSYLFYENFAKIKVQFPSITEQQKIASCLSSLDKVITAEIQKLDLLQDHKRGLLQSLLPVGAEIIPKFRFEEFQDSDEWAEDTLLNLASFRRGSFPQPYGLPEWYDDENGMPFIQVFDVGEDFRLKPTTKNKISELAAKQSVFIPKGTLIITLQGSIGRVAITQYDAYIDRTLLLFEEFHKEIDLTFFAYTIFLLFEIEKQKAPGGIIKTITKEVLSSFVVKLPSIKEQQKIASCFSSLDGVISAQSKKLEALILHKKGLVQGLFPNANEVTE